VLGLGVSEEIRALEHPRRRFDGRCVERDDTMARLALAPSHVYEALDKIHIPSGKSTHRSIALARAIASTVAQSTCIP